MKTYESEEKKLILIKVQSLRAPALAGNAENFNLIYCRPPPSGAPNALQDNQRVF